MKTLATIVVLLCLSLSVPFFTGCNTTQTQEAIVFHSFQDTWSAAHAAYGGFCERVVQGKVSAADEAKADAAWNKFRAAFKVSLRAASTNWNAATPADIQKLADELITIVRTL